MYNLTVAVAHTFFVGEEQWLVHNTRRSLQYDVFDIIRYGVDIVPLNKVRLQNGLERLEKHHAILNEWAAINIQNYGYRKRQAPSILLTESQHAQTKFVYQEWLRSKAGKPVGVSPDWLNTSAEEI
jgi:hypothetical protein